MGKPIRVVIVGSGLSGLAAAFALQERARASNRSLDLVGEVLHRTELPVEPLVVRPETLERRLRESHPLFARLMAEAVRLA